MDTFSRFDQNDQVREAFQIYSNREIARAELILAGDTVKQQEGRTPPLLEADPDTIQWDNGLTVLTTQIAWQIRIWDMQGEYAADSGVSRFMVVRPETAVDASSMSVGEVIRFPLVLKGVNQRFGISLGSNRGVFNIELNPNAADSVVFTRIDQLGEAIMAAVAADDSLWHHSDVYGGTFPTVFISAAVSVRDSSQADRLIIVNQTLGPQTTAVPLDGNEALLTSLGFPEWLRQSPALTTISNYQLDPDVYDRYKSK